MSIDGNPEPLEARVVNMYDESLATYRRYLEDEQPPFDAQPQREFFIGGNGFELIYTVGAKLAQDNGRGVRINFLHDEHPGLATISYESDHEHQRILDLLDKPWKNLGKSAIGSVLIETSSDDCITAAAAIRAGVSVRELLFGFMHLDEDEIKGIEARHKLAMVACNEDADLFFRVILQKHLGDYIDRSILSLMASGVTLSEARQDLLIATDKFDEQETDKYNRDITEDISRRNYYHLGYRTVEDLVQAGYTPLKPEEYVSTFLR